MRARGYFTIEAAYIFTLITSIVVGLLRLDLFLHDSLLSDASKILGGIRYQQTACCYYDNERNEINYLALIKEPLIGGSGRLDTEKVLIEDKVATYYLEFRLFQKNAISSTGIQDVISFHNNASLLRASGKVVQLIQGGE